VGVDTLIEVEDSMDASSGWARRPTEVVVRGTCTRIDQEPGRPPVSVLKLPRRSSGDPDPAQRCGIDGATTGNEKVVAEQYRAPSRDEASGWTARSRSAP